VTRSVPGARPMPRSIRPWCRASSIPNCSATTSGAWLGSITPPDPTRIVEVAEARCAINTAGAELAIPGMLWCSATQCRRYPRRSAALASCTEFCNASAGDDPSPTGARSSTDSGTIGLGTNDANTPRRHCLPLLASTKVPRFEAPARVIVLSVPPNQHVDLESRRRTPTARTRGPRLPPLPARGLTILAFGCWPRRRTGPRRPSAHQDRPTTEHRMGDARLWPPPPGLPRRGQPRGRQSFVS